MTLFSHVTVGKCVFHVFQITFFMSFFWPSSEEAKSNVTKTELHLQQRQRGDKSIYMFLSYVPSYVRILYVQSHASLTPPLCVSTVRGVSTVCLLITQLGIITND